MAECADDIAFDIGGAKKFGQRQFFGTRRQMRHNTTMALA
jgi:hypothetical protein